MHVFNLLNVNPTVDAMASDSNYVCKTFFSVIPQRFSSGVNVFCQNLNDRDIYYFCPPVKLITKVWNFIQMLNVKCILMVPLWKTAHYWPKLFNGHKLHKSILDYVKFTPQFFCSRYSRQNVFNKTSRFEMIAFYIET